MKYNKAEMELVEFDAEDVIVTSGGGENLDTPDIKDEPDDVL